MRGSTPAVQGTRARQVARSYSVRPGWIALAVVAVVSLVAGEIPLPYQYAPLVASVVLIGLPHGAVDHLVVARQRGEALTARWLAIVGGLYLLFGGLYAVVWFVWPVAAFVFFILLTWFHWGQGELYPLLDLVGADYVRAPGGRALTVLVRGGGPMLVPLVAFPDQYEFVASSLIGLFDADASVALAGVFEAGPRLVVATLYGTALLATVALGFYRSRELTPWLLDTGELLGLTLFFLVVPPVLAIGIYFCFWHSLRHVIRTVLLHDESAAALDGERPLAVARQFARDSAPMTAGALVLFGLFYLLVPGSPGGTEGLVALYLVLIATLTLPHVLIVTWLDREQAVF